MSGQEQEEKEFNRMDPYQFEKAAVQQEGDNRPSQQYLITDFDTWVANPFWDGVTPMNFDEPEPED